MKNRQTRNLHQIRQERKVKRERERLIITGLMIPVMIFLFGMAFIFTVKGSSEYYHAHNALFVSSLVCAGAYIVIHRAYAWKIHDLLPKAAHAPKSLGILEWDQLAWTTVFALALFGLLVVDTSFFQHYGLRIGAVCAIALARILRLAYLSASNAPKQSRKKQTENGGTEMKKTEESDTSSGD